MTRRPHMDDQGLLFFKCSLKQSTCYLEYGCGGSTVYACNEAKVQHVISVDSSSDWIALINKEVIADIVDLHLIKIDLGEVGDWGTPKNADRYRDFWKYTVAPWEKATELQLEPDIVLIDGRFRVACFLYSLLCARAGTILIVDDYFDRPEYFIIENFCTLEKRVGRAGVFRASSDFNTAALVSAYARYTLNWD